MVKAKDITGEKFNSLTAIKFVKKVKGQHVWLFKCSLCNNKAESWKAAVIAGQTK